MSERDVTKDQIEMAKKASRTVYETAAEQRGGNPQVVKAAGKIGEAVIELMYQLQLQSGIDNQTGFDIGMKHGAKFSAETVATINDVLSAGN